MPFALTNDPSQSEISEAINYLLANFGPNLAADPNNGQISGPSGVIIAYLYKYIAVKYADSFDGSLNFSNSPTGRLYYGLRNTNDSVESTNPADYIWYQATGGFGSTKFLFYQTNGGRQVNFFVGTAAPDSTYLQESGSSIDLDVVTTTTAYNTAAPSIYYWTTTSTPPSRPSTTSTYTWATGAYTAPAGWATTPPINTTPGSYLWAITIPLIVNSNTITSTLNWTNTSYAIYVVSSNGATGTPGSTGGNGLNALTAYQQLSQSASPPATPANTTGATAPSGWSLTAPSVSVGSVLYYTFGQYNSSSATINGIPAGQTQWGTPTAASIFQDIRSDNWNGTTPPTYGTPSSYGTTGYYISRSTGNCYFNNGIFRGDITGASGSFSGSLNAATGTFAGSLSAATGTFSGALSAATGSFAGSLSAATGSFAGTLSAASGSFTGSLSGATGTFAGALSAATGTYSGALSAATGTFQGTVQSGTTGNRVVLNESSSSYLKVYDSSGNAIYSLLGVAGLYTNSTLNGASALSALTVTNATGYNGSAITGTSNGNGHAVVGVTNDTSGLRNGVLGVSSAAGSSAAAVTGTNTSNYGLYSNGQFGINNSTLVTNLNANYLQGNTSSAFATTASGNTAYDAARLNGSAGLNVLRFVQGTLTGSSVATFNAAAKPGSSSTNVWMQITIDGTTLYIPVWT